MLRFLKSGKQRNAIVALDIGASFLKAIVFTIEQKYNKKGESIGKRAVIHGAGKAEQLLQGSQNTSIADIAGVAEAAKKAIQKAAKSAGMMPGKIILGATGELIRGATSVMTHRREEEEKDTKVNLTELSNIVHKLQWKAFGETRRELSDETGHPELEIKLVSSAVMDVVIDGYKVVNPLGFQGKKIQFTIFNAFSPASHQDALQAIADEIGLELLGIVSEPYAVCRCLNEYTQKDSVILIDIGGLTTDVTVAQEGVIRGTKMFSIGSNIITKRIAAELSISHFEAEKIKQAYTADKLEKKSKQLVQKIIGDDVDLWLSGLTLALSEFVDLKTLPSRILLYGGGAHLAEIKEALTQTKWYKKLPFANKPEVEPVTASHLTNNLIDETRSLKDVEDIPSLALVNMGLEILEEEDAVMPQILKKMIGIMKV